MSTMRERLLASLDNLCSSSSDDYETFQKQWSSLHDDIVLSKHRSEMDDDDRNLASSVSRTIEVVSESLLSLDDVSKQLDDHFAAISSSCKSTGRKKRAATKTLLRRSYIEPCYKWLLDNLHNPYPSDTVRENMAHLYGASRKDIDCWFTNVRKRMGWIDLRNKYFASRKQMIRAATRHFRPSSGDSQRPLDEDFPGVSVAFAALEDLAQEMYTPKLRPSNLCLVIWGDREDLTPELKAQIEAVKKRRQESEDSDHGIVENSQPRSQNKKRNRASEDNISTEQTRKKFRRDASTESERDHRPNLYPVSIDNPNSRPFHIRRHPDVDLSHSLERSHRESSCSSLDSYYSFNLDLPISPVSSMVDCDLFGDTRNQHLDTTENSASPEPGHPELSALMGVVDDTIPHNSIPAWPSILSVPAAVNPSDLTPISQGNTAFVALPDKAPLQMDTVASDEISGATIMQPFQSAVQPDHSALTLLESQCYALPAEWLIATSASSDFDLTDPVYQWSENAEAQFEPTYINSFPFFDPSSNDLPGTSVPDFSINPLDLHTTVSTTYPSFTSPDMPYNLNFDTSLASDPTGASFTDTSALWQAPFNEVKLQSQLPIIGYYTGMESSTFASIGNNLGTSMSGLFF